MSALDYRHTMTFITPQGEVKVEVRELTVAQIRALMTAEAVEPSATPTALDVALWGADPLATVIDVMPADIPRFTDLTEAAAEALTLRQRKALVEKIREVNTDFFGLVVQWPGVVVELLGRQQPETPSPASSDPSPA